MHPVIHIDKCIEVFRKFAQGSHAASRPFWHQVSKLHVFVAEISDVRIDFDFKKYR